MMTRRRALLGAPLLGAPLLGVLTAPALIRSARADERVLRIGYQKYGSLVLMKGRGTLEPRLRALGVRVTWAEFPAGPQLLEAMNAGAIDLGSTGEAPPIFAQSAGVPFVYVANEPAAPRGEAILVPADSALRGVADLRGKRVALNRGSNVHYLLVRALQAAGVRYADVRPVWLPPADARAAFGNGDVDAWAIWDPFLAAAQASTGGRTLVDGTGTDGRGLAANRQLYLAASAYAGANPDVLRAVLDGLADTNAWVRRDTVAAARALAPATGMPAPILEVALGRLAFDVTPLSDAVTAYQQSIADTFLGLGLIPRPIRVADAVRHAPV
jgi:sulfonate transport system substrate-binding protein